MESKASIKHFQMSPRKVRLVANEIRGFSFLEAVDTLRFMPKKAVVPFLSLLNSARANLRQLNEDFQDDQLYVKKLFVDCGPTLKRFRAQSKGRGASRLRRSSRITLVLGD